MVTIYQQKKPQELCDFIRDGRIKQLTDVFMGGLRRSGFSPKAAKAAAIRAGFLNQPGDGLREAFAYTACPACHECVPVRVRLGDFKAGDTISKKLRRPDNAAVDFRVLTPRQSLQYSQDLFDLHQDYMSRRFPHSHDPNAKHYDFQRRLMEASRIFMAIGGGNRLEAAGIAEEQDTHMALDNVFYDLDADPKRSLGSCINTRIALWAQAEGKDYLYLGYWTAHPGPLHYKVDTFKTLEGYDGQAWKDVRANRGMAGPAADAMRARLVP